MKYFVANLKCNLGRAETLKLARQFQKTFKNCKSEVIFCPTSLYLTDVAKIFKSGKVRLGSQNVSSYSFGTFTGEINASQVAELGIKYSIVGHSERRVANHETDEEIALKVKQCLNNNIIPIICVGETAEEKDNKQTRAIISIQVKKAMKFVKNNNIKPIFAYEPLYAISGGKTAVQPTAEEVQKVAKIILANAKIDVKVFYGGSVNSESVKKFLNINEISGVLVGGASLDINKFGQIVKN